VRLLLLLTGPFPLQRDLSTMAFLGTQAHDEGVGASPAQAYLLTGIENKRERMTAWPHMSFTPQMNFGSLF